MKRFVIVLMHAAYWMTYLILILLFLFFVWIRSRHILHLTLWQMVSYSPGLIMLVGVPVLIFYVFYGVLFSRFLKTKRFVRLFVTGVGVAGGATLLALAVVSWLYAPRFQIRLTKDFAMEWLILSIIGGIHGVLAMVIKGFISWYEDIRLKESMELDLIKSQLNPHFLFNTLNNIDVLIQKDAERASVYLNKLSDILRFVLYETNTPQIPIRQELQYIDKYIELQKIRTTHPEYIHYTVEGNAQDRLVEPMLFIPFIENAFKHAEKNSIRVKFTLGDDQIVFVCENKYQEGGSSGGGLGDSLIRRRLALLYPGRHRLDINTGDNIYKATLTLNYAN
ncbi:MAG: histidine kinase [Bacteroidetes bacterium]|nr:histidine kinase [Bacteroidota bacterium]